MAPTTMKLRAGIAMFAVALVGLSGCSSTNAGGGGENADYDIAPLSEGPMSDFLDIAEVCGEGPITVGVVDGYGTNSWSATVKAEIESEAAKCPGITSVEYAAGRGDLTATTSAITSFAAKGTDIILVIADAGPGEAHLPAIRTATDAGSIVVAFAFDPQGEVGVDYIDYVDWIPYSIGEAWGQWVVDQLGEEGGNVVFIGGPPGAEHVLQQLEGVKDVFADQPQITLLTDEPVSTSWDVGSAQQAMSGLLSQYPDIDAVIGDYGTAANGIIRAYEAAGLPLVPLATTDDNTLSCTFDELKAGNPAYELATVSSRTWAGRPALRKGLAALQGLTNHEPSQYVLTIFEDSTGVSEGSVEPAAACIPGAPADAAPSSLLTVEEFEEVFG